MTKEDKAAKTVNRNVTYTREQEEEFISVANEIGIAPAMRELGYPGSHHTAAKWFKSRGLETPNVSSLQSAARALRTHYEAEEELAGIQLMMDRYTDMMMNNDLTPEEFNKLANAYERVIKTKRLIEGKSTGITQNNQYDGTDLEIAKLAAEMEQRNDEWQSSHS